MIDYQETIKSCCFVSIPKNGFRVIWEVTSNCNFECPFCFLPPITKDLPTRKMKDIVDIINNVEISEILISGREPFMRGDLLDILDYINDYGIPISISTNGYLLSNDIIKRLTKIEIKAVNLSVYSHIPEINDKMHGIYSIHSDLLDKLKKATKDLMDANLNVKINIPITTENFPHLLGTINYVVDNFSTKCISLIPLLPVCNGKKYANQSFIDFTNIAPDLEDISNKNNIKLIPIRMKLSEKQKYLDECPAGTKIFSILPNGLVVPCNILAYAKNNLSDYPDIFSINNFEELILEQKEKSEEENRDRIKRYCSSCRYVNNCGGGCKAVSASIFDDVSHPDQLCERYK